MQKNPPIAIPLVGLVLFATGVNESFGATLFPPVQNTSDYSCFVEHRRLVTRTVRL